MLHADPLTDARARFAEKDYPKAAALFEDALKGAPASAPLYFDLARSYAEAGEPARAALNFRRVLLLAPGFQPARSALDKMNSDLAIPAAPRNWRDTLQQTVPFDFVAVSSTVLAWIGGFLLLLSIFAIRSHLSFVSALILMVLGAGGLALVWTTDPRVGADARAIVLAEGAVLHDAPVDGSAPVAKLPQGTMVKLISQRGRWFYGELPSGKSGWFLSEGIVPLVPSAS